MGGGDLNTKKSWHPNTIKNQERVWKAEQQEAEEKKRIMELQKERAEERDREEFNAMANRNMTEKTDAQSDVRLNWMYEKPDKKGQAEDYLLGKSVDDSFEGSAPDKDVIPVVTRRVAGVSMVGLGEAQVDLARKMREDPLLLVQERERAARAALLNNPIQRKKLTELLRQDQEKRKDKKSKKKDSIDNILASKLNALGNKDGGIDLAALLADDSSDSDSDSSSDKKKRKKKKSKKDKKKCKKSKHSESEIEKKEHKSRRELKQVDNKRHKSQSRDRSPIHKSTRNNNEDRARHDSRDKSYRSHNRRKSEDRSYSKDTRSEKYKSYKRSPSPHRRNRSPKDRTTKTQNRRSRSRDKNEKKVRLSSTERAAKLLEMTRNGIENEAQRSQRIAEQKIADSRPAVAKSRPAHSHAHALPDSLETRIRSNRHNIQRNKTHMNEHFARR